MKPVTTSSAIHSAPRSSGGLSYTILIFGIVVDPALAVVDDHGGDVSQHLLRAGKALGERLRLLPAIPSPDRPGRS